jgi:transcriptional regulator with XRE-family HTH domain
MPTKVVIQRNREIGNAIREARNSLLMTQQDLARHVGVSRQMVSRYESGADSPSIQHLAGIARVLEIDQISVEGTIINFRQLAKSDGPKLVLRQLKLPFDKISKYEGATIKIEPRKGRLIFTAVMSA